MTGDALAWFQWLHSSNLLTSWDRFTRDLELPFGPSSFENHQQALFKLKQTSTVQEYQKSFERICNRVTSLPPIAILDCFISGLRFDIQNELAILRPTTISQAIGLAKLVESKLQASRTNPYHKPPPKTFASSSSTPPPLLPTPPPPRLALPAPPPRPPIPIRRLSPAEWQLRRSKGLCFNCDERFVPGHRCKNPQLLLLIADGGDPTQNLDSNEILMLAATTSDIPSPDLLTDPSSPIISPSISDPQHTPENFHLSLHAINGHPHQKHSDFKPPLKDIPSPS
jgi:hypothetical protein